jgi:hypothetical protein
MPEESHYPLSEKRSTAPGVDLQEHLERVIALQVDKLNAAILAVERTAAAALKGNSEAVDRASAAVEKRLEGMNEIRKALSDAQATFATRSEADARFNAAAEKTADLSTRLERIEGAGAGRKSDWGYLVGGISVVLLIVTFVMSFLRK